ncbi:MAG: acetate--CoA ligase family protein, partial [Chloroflexi bacterium]|nr:acetate--CoA ligase family protein [Chloroflexota bacterium]
RGQAQPPKPVLACLMGKASVEAAHTAAHAVEIPPYTFPEEAVEAFSILCRRARWVQRISEHLHPPAGAVSANQRIDEWETGRVGEVAVQRAKARREVQTAILLARSAGRRLLDAAEARPLLQAYGIAGPREFLATSPQDAADFADRIGFPVAMKLISPDILHKTEVGGVILSVGDEQAATAAFLTLVARAQAARPGAHIRGVQVQQMIAGGQEVIIGVKRDPTFGPLVMFGLGGIYVEALADVSFRLAPLSPADAAEMIGEVRSARLLEGVRGAPPADRAALVDAITRVGQLAADHPEIAELDINPLLVLPEGAGVMAVDARMVLEL